jgi:phenylpyruvate tautomerase PptA (4-oxalocrotonate tautomerase family)
MPRARCTFRQRDVTAALKAAIAAGVSVRGVKISAEGDIEVVIGNLPAQDFSAADRNEWDDELNGAAQAEVR